MIRAVIFDWTGTVIDYGSQAPVVALKRAFQKFGLIVGQQQIRQDLGLGQDIHIRRLMADSVLQQQWEASHKGLPISLGAELIYDQFVAEMRAVLPKYAQLRTGFSRLLSFLQNQGIRFATTTSYSSELLGEILPIVKESGFAPQVNITPGDVDGYGRPNPNMIQAAMAELGIHNARFVVKVGDTVNDILEGKAAGALTVGIVEGSNLIGLSKREFNACSLEEQNSLKNQAVQAFEAAGADYVVDDTKQLISLIKELDSEEVLL